MDVDGEGARRLTALVGRDVELGRLRAAVAAGGPVLVAVRGEAGIGKSALVNELAAELRAGGVRVLHGGGAGTPPLRFGMWRRTAHALGIELPDRDPSVGLSEQEWELTDVLLAGLVEVAPAVVVLEDLHRADVSSQGVALSLTGQLALRRRDRRGRGLRARGRRGAGRRRRRARRHHGGGAAPS